MVRQAPSTNLQRLMIVGRQLAVVKEERGERKCHDEWQASSKMTDMGEGRNETESEQGTVKGDLRLSISIH